MSCFNNTNFNCCLNAGFSRVDEYPYDTQVRLVNGGTNYTSSGYVEIYLNYQWGGVCNMNAADADSVCRQLGYSYASFYGDYSGLV